MVPTFCISTPYRCRGGAFGPSEFRPGDPRCACQAAARAGSSRAEGPTPERSGGVDEASASRTIRQSRGSGVSDQGEAAGPSDGRSGRAGVKRNHGRDGVSSDRIAGDGACAAAPACFPGYSYSLPCLIAHQLETKFPITSCSCSSARTGTCYREIHPPHRPVPTKSSEGCRGSVSPGVRPLPGSPRFCSPLAKTRLHEAGEGLHMNPPIPWGQTNRPRPLTPAQTNRPPTLE